MSWCSAWTRSTRRNGVQFVIAPSAVEPTARRQRRSLQRRLQRDLGRLDRPVRRRLDHRDGVSFKSLRYQPGADQAWGINVVRTNRWKNELSFLNPVPKERGQAGVHFSSVAGLLQGIVAPSGSANLDLKPYAISNATGLGGASNQASAENTILSTAAASASRMVRRCRIRAAGG
jgi:hypothetical protein